MKLKFEYSHIRRSAPAVACRLNPTQPDPAQAPARPHTARPLTTGACAFVGRRHGPHGRASTQQRGDLDAPSPPAPNLSPSCLWGRRRRWPNRDAAPGHWPTYSQRELRFANWRVITRVQKAGYFALSNFWLSRKRLFTWSAALHSGSSVRDKNDLVRV